MPDLNRSLLSEGENADTLGGLTDVTASSPEQYQTLVYDGSEWINEYPTTVSLVNNAEATTLQVGEAVYLFSGVGNHASVKRADNDSDETCAKTVGLVAEAISAGGNGPVVTRGYVTGVDLSTGYTAGQTLYLGEDGGFTTTKPHAPEHLVYLGVVVRATSNGIIYVAAQNGYELDEIHDVDLVTNAPVSGDFLKYNGTLWVNDAINLGTDTVGNYMSNISAGTGISVTHTPSEGSTGTVAIDTAVVPRLGVTNTFSTNQIIEGSTTADLLRITQTGTGNALVVEDSANPDSTPFTITSIGDVQIGTANDYGKVNIGGTLALHATTPLLNFVNDSNTRLGYVTHDATNMILLNQISGYMSFGTNNIERMRIDSSGQVGIGGTPSARVLGVAKSITGGTAAYGVVVNGAIQSDVTGAVQVIRSGVSTAAASFTLTSLTNFYVAGISTPGSGSAITNQFGYVVDSSLTGAGNNYGFYGDIAAGTGRYNLYMGGTAANYLAGRLGVGATLTSGAMAQVTNTTASDIALAVKGAVSQTGSLFSAQNSAGTSIFAVNSAGNLDVGQNIGSLSAFMQLGNGRTADGYSYIDFVGDLTYSDYGLRIIRGNIGANSSSQLVHRGTGDLSLFATDAGQISFSTTSAERMRIDSAGQVGIGAVQSATGLNISKSITGSVNAQAVRLASSVASDVTGEARYMTVVPSVDASVAVGNLIGIRVYGATLGSGASVTTQYGFFVDSGLTTGTTNYGFYGNIASATGRWNLYMAGTAANYLAGRLGVGATLTSGAMAQVVNTTAADKAFVIKGAASQSGNLQEWQNSAGSVLAYVAADGSSSFGNAADSDQAIIASSVFS